MSRKKVGGFLLSGGTSLATYGACEWIGFPFGLFVLGLIFFALGWRLTGAGVTVNVGWTDPENP